MVEEWLRGREMETVIVEHKVCLRVFVYACVCMFVCVTDTDCVCVCACVYVCVLQPVYLMLTSLLSQSSILPSTLLKCLQAGTPLVITAVDTVELEEDRFLMDMLQCRSSLHNVRGGQKIMVGRRDPCVC